MSSTRWHLHRNKVLCFDSPTRYLLIFDIVITHNGDEPLKDTLLLCFMNWSVAAAAAADMFVISVIFVSVFVFIVSVLGQPG